MSSLKAGIQKQVRVYLNNRAFRGGFLVLASVSHKAPLFMIRWNFLLDLFPHPCFAFPPPLCLLSLSPATHSALRSNMCPAPSCSLWKPICAVKFPTYNDHTLLSGSHSLLVFYQFKSVDFSGVASPLAAFGKSQNLCIWPGCSRIKSSQGTKGSCCLLSKIKHPLHL